MGDLCPQVERINAVLFTRSAVSPKPNIGLYGDHDSSHTLTHSRADFDAFVTAVGTGEFHAYQSTRDTQGHHTQGHHTRGHHSQGHRIFTTPEVWENNVARFMKDTHLVTLDALS